MNKEQWAIRSHFTFGSGVAFVVQESLVCSVGSCFRYKHKDSKRHLLYDKYELLIVLNRTKLIVADHFVFWYELRFHLLTRNKLLWKHMNMIGKALTALDDSFCPCFAQTNKYRSTFQANSRSTKQILDLPKDKRMPNEKTHICPSNDSMCNK